MLLKPLISKVNSLPLVDTNSHLNLLDGSSLVGGIDPRECDDYRNTNGRLLILEIVNREHSLKNNKKIHDSSASDSCSHFWYSCHCDYSKRIRAMDMNIDVNRIKNLKEVL